MFEGKLTKYEFKPDALSIQVSRILTEAIMDDVLKGGDKLVEAELQKQFGISRSPLREAFRDLEKKGLVVIVPRKGTYVRRITLKDIEENFPVRAVLEGLAAKEACNRITENDIDEMEDILVELEEAAEKNDMKTYKRLHLLFHEIFIEASGNEVLIDILKTLRMHSMWYRFASKYYKQDFKSHVAIHREILSLFKYHREDAERVGQRIQNHIEMAYENFLSFLEDQNEVF